MYDIGFGFCRVVGIMFFIDDFLWYYKIGY